MSAPPSQATAPVECCKIPLSGLASLLEGTLCFKEESLLASLTFQPRRILTVLLMIYRIKGAILIGIFLTSVISWPRPTAVTYFPHTASGDDMFNFFKQVVTFHPLKYTGNAVEVSAILGMSMFPYLLY